MVALGRGGVFYEQGTPVPRSWSAVWGSGFKVEGSGFRIQYSGCRFQSSVFRVQGSGFRIADVHHVVSGPLPSEEGSA